MSTLFVVEGFGKIFEAIISTIFEFLTEVKQIGSESMCSKLVAYTR